MSDSPLGRFTASTRVGLSAFRDAVIPSRSTWRTVGGLDFRGTRSDMNHKKAAPLRFRTDRSLRADGYYGIWRRTKIFEQGALPCTRIAGIGGHAARLGKMRRGRRTNLPPGGGLADADRSHPSVAFLARTNSYRRWRG